MHQAYGTLGKGSVQHGSSFLAPKARRRMNVFAIAANLFVPWLIFCLVSAMLSFEMHYRQPSTCQALAIAAAALLIFAGLCDMLYIFWNWEAARGSASWLLFLCASSLVAVCLGIAFGDENFWRHSEPFFDITALNSYEGVDPSQVRGQELMDAGRVIFAKNARLDLARAMGFKSQDTFCVAPITMSRGEEGLGNALLPSYDFWAVGKDCCSGGTAADFHCGAYDNPRAHAGVRLVRDEDRGFFRLAVEQAQSAHSIRATHPLFFHWVEDPLAETYAYQQEAFKSYMLAMTAYLVCQLAVVAAGSWVFSVCSVG